MSQTRREYMVAAAYVVLALMLWAGFLAAVLR